MFVVRWSRGDIKRTVIIIEGVKLLTNHSGAVRYVKTQAPDYKVQLVYKWEGSAPFHPHSTLEKTLEHISEK